jgi:transposase
MIYAGSRVIILDNASIHKIDEVHETVAASRTFHRIQFLPPYSPQLNPIEYMFKKVKIAVTHDLAQTQEHLVTLIERALRTVTQQDCAGWYRESIRQYFKCIEGEPLV